MKLVSVGFHYEIDYKRTARGIAFPRSQPKLICGLSSYPEQNRL